MTPSKIVARYLDGRVLRGYTANFLPAKDYFHLELVDAPPGAKPVEVRVAELKAVFFVKDFTGDSKRYDAQATEEGKPTAGRKIRVTFGDGETLVGTTQGYDAARPGFFIKPVDAASNNERCFVVARAAKAVSFL